MCEQTAELREALQALYDCQNGPPLPKYAEQWEAAMTKAASLLGGANNGKEVEP